MKPRAGAVRTEEASPRETEDQFIAQVRGRLKDILDNDPNLRAAEVAMQAGISSATISLFLADKYEGNNMNMARKVHTWINSIEARNALREITPDAPRFFESQMAREVITAFRYAQSLEDLVVVVGAPGLGKTTSCIEYRRAHPNVWIATLAPQRAAMMPVLKEVCAAVGGSPMSNADQIAREIIRKIRGRQGLLIIDEAHHASPSALDAIRSLHDETSVGVALIGGPELAGKVESMPQLHSRVGLRLSRAGVVMDDITALLDAWQVRDQTARRELAQISQRPGALRSVTKVLRLAASVARGAGETLGLPHIREAAQTLSSRATERDHE